MWLSDRQTNETHDSAIERGTARAWGAFPLWDVSGLHAPDIRTVKRWQRRLRRMDVSDGLHDRRATAARSHAGKEKLINHSRQVRPPVRVQCSADHLRANDGFPIRDADDLLAEAKAKA